MIESAAVEVLHKVERVRVRRAPEVDGEVERRAGGDADDELRGVQVVQARRGARGPRQARRRRHHQAADRAHLRLGGGEADGRGRDRLVVAHLSRRR